MNKKIRRQYAFIINIEGLPNPFLIQVGRHSNHTIDALEETYKNNLIKISRGMNDICRAIIHDVGMNRYREVLKISLLKIIQGSPQEENTSTMKDRIIKDIIQSEIKKIINVRTRYGMNVASKIEIKFWLVKRKRMKEEEHLPVHFSSDVKRSIRELRYIISQRV